MTSINTSRIPKAPKHHHLIAIATKPPQDPKFKTPKLQNSKQKPNTQTEKKFDLNRPHNQTMLFKPFRSKSSSKSTTETHSLRVTTHDSFDHKQPTPIITAVATSAAMTSPGGKEMNDFQKFMEKSRRDEEKAERKREKERERAVREAERRKREVNMSPWARRM